MLSKHVLIGSKRLLFLFCGSVQAFLATQINIQPHFRTKIRTCLEAEKLVFESTFNLTSPEPIASDFFQTTAFRNHCLSAGGTRQLFDNIPWTPTLESLWSSLEHTSTTAPTANTDDGLPDLVSTHTTVQFPGLLVNTTIFVASRCSTPRCYETWLVGEKQSLTGAPPVVWLYRKLVGENEENSKTRSHTTLQLLEDSNRLCMEADISISVEFPSVMLRLLPTSREKMEQQGSKAVAKVLARELKSVIDGLPQAAETWARKNQEPEVSMQ